MVVGNFVFDVAVSVFVWAYDKLTNVIKLFGLKKWGMCCNMVFFAGG